MEFPGRLLVIFLLPLVSGSQVFGTGLPKECVSIFLGDDFRNGFRIQSYLNRQWIDVLAGLRGVWKNFTRVLREGGLRIDSTRWVG